MLWCPRLVEGAVAEHGVENVAASSGESDKGLVVAFALSDFAVVVGARDRIAEGGEGGEKQRPLQDLVSASGGVLAANR